MLVPSLYHYAILIPHFGLHMYTVYPHLLLGSGSNFKANTATTTMTGTQ